LDQQHIPLQQSQRYKRCEYAMVAGLEYLRCDSTKRSSIWVSNSNRRSVHVRTRSLCMFEIFNLIQVVARNTQGRKHKRDQKSRIQWRKDSNLVWSSEAGRSAICWSYEHAQRASSASLIPSSARFFITGDAEVLLRSLWYCGITLLYDSEDESLVYPTTNNIHLKSTRNNTKVYSPS
jgi:hypothetical protein